MFWARFLCRICATIGTTSYPIFEKATNRNLESKIKQCLNLDVFEDDFKPKVVCETCFIKLNDISDFIELCHSSNSKFEHILYQSEKHLQVPGFTWHDRQESIENCKRNDINSIDGLPEESKDECTDFLKIYGDDTYQHKYDENTTVLRHSSQFQHREKEIENVNITQNCNQQNDEVVSCIYSKTNFDYTIGNEKVINDISPRKEIVMPIVDSDENKIVNTVNNENGTRDRKENKVNRRKHNLISVESIIKVVKEGQEEQIQFCVPPKPKDNKLKVISDQKKRLMCPECKRVFTRKFNLRIHMSRHSNSKPFVCEICEKSFVVQYDLKLHKRVHGTEYMCKVCLKSFIAPSKLQSHMRIHTNNRIFTCSVESCGKSFTDKSNLHGHMLVHTDERKFGCDICKKAYKTKSQLVDHLRIHSSDLPFKCPVCGVSYKWKANLVMHMKKHEGYRCKQCDTDCGKVSSLIKHRKECVKSKMKCSK